jgi:hypothetical protein
MYPCTKGLPNTCSSSCHSTLSKVSPVLVDDDFLEGLESLVPVYARQSRNSHSEVKAHELALCWQIAIEVTEKT